MRGVQGDALTVSEVLQRVAEQQPDSAAGPPRRTRRATCSAAYHPGFFPCCRTQIPIRASFVAHLVTDGCAAIPKYAKPSTTITATQDETTAASASSTMAGQLACMLDEAELSAMKGAKSVALVRIVRGAVGRRRRNQMNASKRCGIVSTGSASWAKRRSRLMLQRY